jgi:predicted nucleotidyltransferase/DNA-binding HxlR family transcriptional regulator
MGADGVDVLLRPASRRVLGALLTGRRSLTELAAVMGVAKPSLQPTLKRLAELGWIRREEIRAPTGREVYYSLQSASLHVELRPEHGVAIAWASAGPIDDDFPLASTVGDVTVRQEILVALRLLREKMRGLFAKNAFSIVLFGSAARGEMTWKSDIDLLFIEHYEDPGPLYDHIQNCVADIQDFVTHPVRAHFVSLDEFMRGKKAIAKEAAREGLVLHAQREAPLWAKMEKHRAISL